MHVDGLSRLIKWSLASVVQHPDRYQVLGLRNGWYFQVASLEMICFVSPSI